MKLLACFAVGALCSALGYSATTVNGFVVCVLSAIVVYAVMTVLEKSK